MVFSNEIYNTIIDFIDYSEWYTIIQVSKSFYSLWKTNKIVLNYIIENYEQIIFYILKKDDNFSLKGILKLIPIDIGFLHFIKLELIKYNSHKCLNLLLQIDEKSTYSILYNLLKEKPIYWSQIQSKEFFLLLCVEPFSSNCFDNLINISIDFDNLDSFKRLYYLNTYKNKYYICICSWRPKYAIKIMKWLIQEVIYESINHRDTILKQLVHTYTLDLFFETSLWKNGSKKEMITIVLNNKNYSFFEYCIKSNQINYHDYREEVFKIIPNFYTNYIALTIINDKTFKISKKEYKILIECGFWKELLFRKDLLKYFYINPIVETIFAIILIFLFMSIKYIL